MNQAAGVAPPHIGDRFVVIGTAAILLATAVLASGLLPLPEQSLCWSQLILGTECPGCGLTRGFIAIAQLRLSAAQQLNPLALPLFLFFLLHLVVRVGGRYSLVRHCPGTLRLFTIGSSVAILIAFAVRMATFYFS